MINYSTLFLFTLFTQRLCTYFATELISLWFKFIIYIIYTYIHIHSQYNLTCNVSIVLTTCLLYLISA